MWDNVRYERDAWAYLGTVKGVLFILADTHTHRYCYPLVSAVLPPHKLLVIEAGESSKSLAVAQKIWTWLYTQKADRNDTLVTLGGGVVCDLGAFAASVYKRGMRLVHVPTSLLAMVDAAHGGKTAVNYRGTKNVLGTFYRADAVLVIPQFLDTLPQPEMWNGWAEVVKHMLLALPEAWKAGAANQVSDGITTIRASIEVKQRIVLADPQEKGERKLLNLGHTVGHALEALSWAQKNPIKHGHAVAWGLYTEACIGARVGVTSSNLVAELAAWVEKLYPRPVFAPNSKKLKTYLYQDKKNINGDLMLSLCKSPGDAVYHIAIKPEVVMAQIKEDYFR